MVPPAILPHTALAAVNVGSRIKVYFQGETGELFELATEDDRVYVCKEIVMPKRLDGFVPAMFTPLTACVFDEGVEVRIYFLDENSIIRELCWTEGHNAGLWYLGELGQLGIVAAHYSDLAVVHFGGKFRLYYQNPKDNMIAEVCRNENDLWVKGSSLVAATPGTRLAATISHSADLVNVYYQEKNLHPSVMIISPNETTVETAFSSEIPLPHRSAFAALNLKLHTHNAGTGMSVYTQLQDNLVGKLWSSSEDSDWDFDILVDCGPLTSIAVVSGVKADDDWSDGLRVFFVSQDPRMVVDGKDSMVVIGKKAWSEAKGWLVEKRVTPVYPRGDWESIEMHGLTTNVASTQGGEEV